MPFPISISFVVITSLVSVFFPTRASLSKQASDFDVIRAEVQSYEILTGSLPDPKLGLNALVKGSEPVDREQKWIKPWRMQPKDPWGREYQYVAGSGYPDGFGIYSTGPDGITETQGNDPDDSNSW
jgi:type II secretory pathway pseudopilin PulG